MQFGLDVVALGAALIFALIFLLIWNQSRSWPAPYIGFSRVGEMKTVMKSHPITLAHWSLAAYRLSLLILLFSFADPYLLISRKSKSSPSQSQKKRQGHRPMSSAIEGRAIYLVLDQSGSMAQKILTSLAGKEVLLSKIDLLKAVTEKFIVGDPKEKLSGRDDDLMGLVSFARVPQVLVPLTLDHEAILKKLKYFDVVRDRDVEGTSIGYAIFKTAHLMAATKHLSQENQKTGNSAYEIKGAAIVLVTDGFQETNPLDRGNRERTIGIEEAAKYAGDHEIKLYIVNVDPRFQEATFAPHRNQMQKAAESTGGHFWVLSDTQNLSAIYAAIDRLEKGKISIIGDKGTKGKYPYDPRIYRRVSLFPYFLIVALAFCAAAVVLETLVERRVP